MIKVQSRIAGSKNQDWTLHFKTDKQRVRNISHETNKTAFPVLQAKFIQYRHIIRKVFTYTITAESNL